MTTLNGTAYSYPGLGEPKCSDNVPAATINIPSPQAVTLPERAANEPWAMLALMAMLLAAVVYLLRGDSSLRKSSTKK